MQARRGAIEDEFADRLDKEVGPFGAAVLERLVEREQRFGLFAGDDAIAPAFAAQGEELVSGDLAIGGSGPRDLEELGGHGGLSPVVFAQGHATDSLKAGLPYLWRSISRRHAPGSVSAPPCLTRAATWVAVGSAAAARG